MTLDDTLIKKLASLKDMIDKFVNQRNMCNKTMKIMSIELEKMHVFTEKLGQHLNKNSQQTSAHINALSQLKSELHSNKDVLLGGAKKKESVITIMHGSAGNNGAYEEIEKTDKELADLTANIESQIADLMNDKKKRDKKYTSDINKALSDMDLSKAEMKKKIKSLTTAHNKKNNAFNKELENHHSALSKAKQGHDKHVKKHQSDAINELSKQDKVKFIDLLSRQLEEYENETKTEMVNISEVWDALKNSVVDLKKSAHMPSEVAKKGHGHDAGVDIELLEDNHRLKPEHDDVVAHKYNPEQLMMMDDSKPYDEGRIKGIIFTNFTQSLPVETRLRELLDDGELSESGIKTKSKRGRGAGRAKTNKRRPKKGKGKGRGRGRARTARALLSNI